MSRTPRHIASAKDAVVPSRPSDSANRRVPAAPPVLGAVEGIRLSFDRPPTVYLKNRPVEGPVGRNILRWLSASGQSLRLIVEPDPRGNLRAVLVGDEPQLAPTRTTGAELADHQSPANGPPDHLTPARVPLPAPPPPAQTFGDVVIDVAARRVFRGGIEIAMRPREYALLFLLAAHPDQVLSREALLAHAWDAAPPRNSRTLDMHIASLRRKLGDDGTAPRLIETARKVGYRWTSLAAPTVPAPAQMRTPGLEPGRVAPPAPKAGASTNFATSARDPR